jgi:hypothetical protein
VNGDDLGAARVAALRSALERVRDLATKADADVWAPENGPAVTPASWVERILDEASDALSDDALTRDRPTSADLRRSADAAVNIDHAIERGRVVLTNHK